MDAMQFLQKPLPFNTAPDRAGLLGGQGPEIAPRASFRIAQHFAGTNVKVLSQTTPSLRQSVTPPVEFLPAMSLALD